MKETLQAFFFEGWRHKRVEAEIAKRIEVSEKRAAAGAKGGSRTHLKNFMNEANASVCSSMTQSQRKISSTASVERGTAEGRLTLSPAALAGVGVGRKQ
jgi:uncharacterized protein YdaU (DUF1376 family)